MAAAGLAAHMASDPLLLWAPLGIDPETTRFVAVWGCLYAPIWGAVFTVLYRNFSRNKPRRPS